MKSPIAFLAPATLVLGLWLGPAHAQQAQIKSQRVAEGIHMLTGQGGNIAVLSGADGTFMIDDQFAPLTDRILAAITELGGDSPRFLINTHFHGDHTGGNENLGSAGTVIFSHDNVRRRLTMETVIRAFNMVTPPQPPAALPVVTFSQDLTFHLNGHTVHAFHVPNAHTDGDAIVHFAQANVIHAGDTLFNGFFPFIDTDHGGTVRGMIAAADAILALSDDDTRIIPGHGPLADKRQVQRYRAMLATAQARLGRLKSEGKSVEQAVAAKPLDDLQSVWGNAMFDASRWIEIVYDGV